MKNLFVLFLLSLLFSCKKQEVFYANITQNPKLFFDGKSIIDKNRNDSIICDLNQKVPYPINYKFDETFDLQERIVKNKKKLKIEQIRKASKSENYYTCDCSIDDVLKKANIDYKSYDLFNKKEEIEATISEYIFKEKKDLHYAYKIIFNYTKFLRELRRDKYEFRCCDTKLDNTYYISLKGNKLYLISSSYNFHYYPPNYNIEGEVQQNKEIIMDDVFKLINEN